MYTKSCKICGCAFEATGPAALYCEVHKVEQLAIQKQKTRLATAAWRLAHNKIQKPGVGKGGNVARGKDHPSFKHGYHMADRFRPIVKRRRYCERCDRDLQDANRWQWVVHHKDHNHCNNVIDNLELLCKRCHQIEHECHKAFNKGATTIPKGSTLK